jgi:hypothetical protein
VSSFRYLGVNILSRAHVPYTFNIVEKGMKFEYVAPTLAHAIWQKEVDNAANATKHIL